MNDNDDKLTQCKVEREIGYLIGHYLTGHYLNGRNFKRT